MTSCHQQVATLNGMMSHSENNGVNIMIYILVRKYMNDITA